ncbi:MAG TPA: hypothetical protein VHS96_04760, partial [Bacteroidia bacterium]|nr:hypothetical protein [Bacteroidia bacterium]
MISQLIYPPTLNPARNPITVQLRTDNVVTTPGTRAELKFGWIGPAAPGDQLQLIWGGEDITFTFAASPDDSGTQLTAYPGAGTLIAWAQTLVSDFKRNYALNRDHVVSYAGAFLTSPTISILAREVGTDYDVTTGTVPGFYIFRARTNGVDAVSRERFRIITEIQVEESYGADLWETIVVMDPAPDGNGDVALDLAEICRGKLSADLPTFNQAIALPAFNMRQRFRLLYCESWGDPVTY